MIRRLRRIAKGKVDLTDDDRIFNPSRETRQIFAHAQRIGPNASALCQSLYDQQGRLAHRHLWGIVQLARRYPGWLVEELFTTAHPRGSWTYKAIRALVEQRLAQLAQSHEPENSSSAPVLTQDYELNRDISRRWRILPRRRPTPRFTHST